MQFCEDACKAAALNHLLFRIAGKSKDQPKEDIQAGNILWYAKTEQITEEMSNAWGVCKVRKEVNGLITMGIIGRKNNPEWGADRTKHFCFGEKECRKLLEFCEMHQICVVHLKLPPEVMHLIYSSNANDKSIKCICAIHQMELIDISNANDKYIEAIPIDRPTIDDYKEGDTPAPIDLQEWKTESGKMPAMPKGQHDDRTSDNSSGDSGVHGGLREDVHRSRGGDTPLVDETIPTEGLPAPAALTELPPSVQQGAMAMTPRQIKAQAERREKELWAIFEEELHTTFTANQRKLHKDGMALHIADDISDETIRAGCRVLDAWQRKNFTVYKFYGWLPNLSAKGPPKTNGTSAQPFVIDQERNQRNIEAMKARNAEKRRLAASG